MTDITAILSAIDNEEIIEHCRDTLLEELCNELKEELLECLAKKFPKDTLNALHSESSSLPEDETLALLERIPEDAVVAYVVENYSEPLKDHAIELVEQDEQIVLSIEELRRAVRHGELLELVTRELTNRGVPPWM